MYYGGAHTLMIFGLLKLCYSYKSSALNTSSNHFQTPWRNTAPVISPTPQIETTPLPFCVQPCICAWEVKGVNESRSHVPLTTQTLSLCHLDSSHHMNQSPLPAVWGFLGTKPSTPHLPPAGVGWGRHTLCLFFLTSCWSLGSLNLSI